MNIYAGTDNGIFEFAIWAPNKTVAKQINKRIGGTFGELHEQGAHLKKLCPDRSKVYKRDLGHDENEWQEMKNGQ